MSLPSENKPFDNDRLIEFFRFNTSADNRSYSGSYTIGVRNLISYLKGCDSPLLPEPETAICNWVVNLCVGGTACRTAATYINCVSGLYNKAVKEGLAPATDVFSELKAKFREQGASVWNTWLTDNDLNKLTDLSRSVSGTTGDAAQKMVLYSLSNGCMPLTEAARIKIDELSDAGIELLGLDKTHFTRNRRYIFPLDQGNLTEGQLAKTVNGAVLALLTYKNICHSPSADDTLRSYWAFAAVRMGVAPTLVRSYFKTVPSGLPILSVCKTVELTEDKRKELTTGVAKMFSSNPPQWFVMRLRQRVRFIDIEERFENLRNVMPKPELFYPCEEILRKTGNKKETVLKPVIPDIVFFKCRETEVYPMFLKIGDMAWCYKADGKSGNRYAAIPKQSFELFQQAIGQFTPDYEVAPIGELTPEPGDEIVVVGGMFRNIEGNIEKIEERMTDSNKIYRIEVIPENGMVWKIGIDARIARKKK